MYTINCNLAIPIIDGMDDQMLPNVLNDHTPDDSMLIDDLGNEDLLVLLL